MNSYNQVRLMGKIAFDPEIKDIGNGKRVGNFRLEAVAERGKTYVDVTCWDSKLIDMLNTSLVRGDTIKLAGELRSSSWATKDGDKRSKVYVVANAIVDMANHQESVDKTI